MQVLRTLSWLSAALFFAAPAFAIDGLRVEEDGNLIAEVSGTTATGEVSVAHEETSGTLLVTFRNGTIDYVPVPGDSLTFSIADTGIATGAALGGFALEVTGVIEGMTEITFSLRNNGLIYEAPPIELHVEEHVEADGLVLTHRGSEVVLVWQGFVTGSLQIPQGGSTDDVSIEFLSPASSPEEAVRFVPEEGGPFLMGLTTANSLIATADSVGHFVFRGNGVGLGTTSLVVEVLHEDHADFTSPAIPLTVLPANVTDVAVVASPVALQLQPAWPNPFQQGTRVDFSLDRSSPVDLGVFDVMGRRVDTLARGIHQPGAHSVSWSPENRPTGVYFVRLTTPSAVSTTKVVYER